MVTKMTNGRTPTTIAGISKSILSLYKMNFNTKTDIVTNKSKLPGIQQRRNQRLVGNGMDMDPQYLPLDRILLFSFKLDIFFSQYQLYQVSAGVYDPMHAEYTSGH